MSTLQPSAFPPPPAPAGGNGLTIGALVCGIIGFLIPLVGPVAIVLAIVALVKPAPAGRGKGLQVAALVIAIIGTVVNCGGVMAGVMLPALGKARQSARELRSSVQLRTVGMALHQYASENKDWFPESRDGLDRLVQGGALPAELLVSPHADSFTGPSYIYVPPTASLSEIPRPTTQIVAYENPAMTRRACVVLFADGRVDVLTHADLATRLAAQGEQPPPAGPGVR